RFVALDFPIYEPYEYSGTRLLRPILMKHFCTQVIQSSISIFRSQPFVKFSVIELCRLGPRPILPSIQQTFLECANETARNQKYLSVVGHNDDRDRLLDRF